jgi:hypothetical protein
MSDDEIKEIIKKHRNNLTLTRERCFYEDCWMETVLDDEAVFRMIKEILENERT